MKKYKHPAQAASGLQLLSMLFLLACGCASTPPPGLDRLPEGLYRFESRMFYEEGMARITHTSKGAQVQLLETFQGRFTLRPNAAGDLTIVEDEVGYPGLRRSLKGSGKLTGPGQASGDAVIWLKSMGPVSRNHREGAWSLRRATPKEIRKYQAKLKLLEERKERAREGGLTL